jgi:hypothetical protein
VRRPCLTCGNLIESGSRCRRCARAREVGRRGSSGKQATFRRRTFRLSNGLCVRCGEPAVVAHHTPAISERGDPDKPGEALCERCHQLVHR